VTAAALDQLAAVRARRRVGAIRDALAVADDLLAQSFADRDWEALGHPDWATYCATELPELRHLKLRAEPRRARVAALLAAGAPSVRDLAAATGAAVGTIHGDLARLRPAAPSAPVSKVARTLELVAAAGAAGLTVEQLRRATRWHHGQASAVLHRLAAAGRVTYRRPARRGQFGTYVAQGVEL
jgi:hypothetical protein